MADTNKVLFGFSDLYIGTYEVAADGTVTLGTPYHQAGAVGFSPEDNAERSVFYADNIEYYVSYTSGSYEGDLEVAKFDDEFKKQFLGYVNTAQGGLAQVKNAITPSIWLAFEVQGDKQGRRVIMYNGALGGISRQFSTLEDTKKPVTESVSVSFSGDNNTGITMATYNPGDAGYDTLFTAPPVPQIAETTPGDDTTSGDQTSGE